MICGDRIGARCVRTLCGRQIVTGDGFPARLRYLTSANTPYALLVVDWVCVAYRWEMLVLVPLQMRKLLIMTCL